ncbi:hypothetical protein BY458DRAFT_573126 [Sporodiniella umbellata]|nr:hypothetical protein BY458DRAFT_573126 [Sporodiniella umbellata]
MKDGDGFRAEDYVFMAAVNALLSVMYDVSPIHNLLKAILAEEDTLVSCLRFGLPENLNLPHNVIQDEKGSVQSLFLLQAYGISTSAKTSRLDEEDANVLLFIFWFFYFMTKTLAKFTIEPLNLSIVDKLDVSFGNTLVNGFIKKPGSFSVRLAD